MPRLPFLLLLLVISAAIALWESPPQLLQEPENTEEASYPAVYMEAATNYKYNESGNLTYTFKADRVNYFEFKKAQNNYAVSTNPDITVYRENDLPWHIKAEHGHTDSAGKIITLTGNVYVWQIDSLQRKTELKTEKLVVIPEQEYAKTDKAVTLIAPTGVTTAVGMEAFFKQDRLLLLSQVKSRIRNNHDKR